MVLKDPLRDAQVSHGSIARTQARWALDLVLSPHRAKKGYWINGWLGFLRDVSSKPDFHARERDVEESTEGEG